MIPPVDPNAVLMTGENSFVRLSPDGGRTISDRFSHWRVLWCPAGTGHTLFVHSALTDGHVRIYSDNIAVTRWLQATIETLLYAPFADPRLPVIDAGFDRDGDPRSAATETIVATAETLTLTWYDFGEPFVITVPPGTNNRPLGVFSTFFPARGAQVEMSGRFASEMPWPEMRGDRQSSSACLAWSETWVKPKG